MNKREVVWLITRLIGLYLLYSAIVSGIAFLGLFMTALQTPDLFSRSLGLFAQSLFMIAAQGIVGIYLLKDGGLLFDILHYEKPAGDS